MIKITKATTQQIELVYEIVQTTINSVYPHFYPKGVVKYFSEYHQIDKILMDIQDGNTYLINKNNNYAGTITIVKNKLHRFFVVPDFQKQGLGSKLLNFAEKTIFRNFNEVITDTSIPAKKFYLIRHYIVIKTGYVKCENDDIFCYERMIKVN